MVQEIYRKLANHLDELPGGFPRTESGIELRILQKLFSPDNAELALHLTLIPEKPRVIARRANISVDQASSRLEKMAKKGLIYRHVTQGRPMKYGALQYVIGIWEYQMNNLDLELIKDMDEYLPILFDSAPWEKSPQLRVVPVGKSLTPQHEVMSYEKAEELVRSQKKFAVRPCICRKEKSLIGKSCGKPMEVCLVFGIGVETQIINNMAREIDLTETLDILKIANESGLVLQPSYSKEVLWLCCCCGCCCRAIEAYKRYPNPNSLVASPFQASLEIDACNQCAVCLSRCQMGALTLKEDKISLDKTQCIGCGLCVSTCPTGALSLERKQAAGQQNIPKNYIRSLFKLGRVRGKLNNKRILQLLLKSIMDRVFALTAINSQ
jgi:electron transport complex protein RnfB